MFCAPFGYLYFHYFRLLNEQELILAWLWHHFHLVFDENRTHDLPSVSRVRLPLDRIFTLYLSCVITSIRLMYSQRLIILITISQVSIINSKFPNIGELLLKRLIVNFKRGFKRNDKTKCMSSTRFIAHLINQQVRFIPMKIFLWKDIISFITESY